MGWGAVIKATNNITKGTKNITRSMGLGQHAIGMGMAVGMGVMSSNGNMGEAILKGAGMYALEAVVPGAFMVNTVADMGGAAATAYIDHKRYGNARIQKYYRGNFGGNFQDTQAGYTMRQRGVQAIQQSKLNARSVLGSEARSFHSTY